MKKWKHGLEGFNVTMIRLTLKEMPAFKISLLEKQGWRCPLCRINLRYEEPKNLCVDHDHKTGFVRGVLCRNCNAMEGKVNTAATRAKRDATALWWLGNLVQYLQHNLDAPSNVCYPSHKTDDEKRELKNKRARLKRKREATVKRKRK